MAWLQQGLADGTLPVNVAGALVHFVRGARSLRAAGADERVVAVARRWGTAPITAGLSGATAEVLMECLPLAERTGALGRYLHTIQSSGFQSERVLHDLGDVYRMAIDPWGSEHEL